MKNSTVVAMIIIRQASIADLPAIHDLIRESYSAMIPHSYLLPSFWIASAEKTISTDLSQLNFESNYINNNKPDNCFWVAEATDSKIVVGCVGLKRENKDNMKEGELVRMSVCKNQRGKGIGQLLIKNLVSYCSKVNINRVVFTTANPDSAKFYSKNGFILYNRFLFQFGVLSL